MTVIVDRDGGDLARTHKRGWARFERAVRREISKRGGQRPSLRIARNLFAALADPAGVIAHRHGALERVALVLEDWAVDQQRLAETERRMVAVLDELELTELVTSIHGISAVGAAAILAETGDPHRFATARAMVKHAGLAPREKLSGTFTGRTKLTGQGRPRLRVAAWRAVWGSLQTNTVYAARYRHLTTREHNKLNPTQAQTVIAAAILRHLHAVVTTGHAWDPADRRRRHQAQRGHLGRLTTVALIEAAAQADGRGEPYAALRTTSTSSLIMGSPARRLNNPITRCRAPARSPLCRDRRRTRHRPTA